MSAQRILASLLFSITAPLLAQNPPPPPAPEPAHDISTHDISQVEPAQLGGVIAIPIPGRQQRKLKKYDMPELVGARQALGSQLIDGELPKPILDYFTRAAMVEQRVSFFQGGLVVLRMTGPGGIMRKRVIIPPDALSAYRKAASPELIARIRGGEVSEPKDTRRSLLRAYRDDGSHVELSFDPAGVLPNELKEQIAPLEDLIRTLSEDRTVTSTVAGYEPSVGDELVGDDQKLWRIERIIADAGIVQLRCVSEPTVIYVDKRYLYNYFIGKKAARDE